MSRPWPLYQTLRPLIHAHLGRPALIMGGGASLLQAFPSFPPNAVHISVNDHGCRFMRHTLGIDRQPDYIVACDRIERQVRFDVRPPGTGAPWRVPLISRWMFADYRMLFSVAPNSGVAAAWAARLMGCAPIILAGMDLYVGPTYFDAPTAISSGRNVPPAEHRQRWYRLSKYPGMYRTLGGDDVLASHFGVYDPAEPVRLPPPPVSQLAFELQRYRVRLTADALITQRPFSDGAVLDIAQREHDHLVRQRKAVSLPVIDDE